MEVLQSKSENCYGLPPSLLFPPLLSSPPLPSPPSPPLPSPLLPSSLLSSSLPLPPSRSLHQSVCLSVTDSLLSVSFSTFLKVSHCLWVCVCVPLHLCVSTCACLVSLCLHVSVGIQTPCLSHLVLDRTAATFQLVLSVPWEFPDCKCNSIM